MCEWQCFLGEIPHQGAVSYKVRQIHAGQCHECSFVPPGAPELPPNLAICEARFITEHDPPRQM